MLFIEEVGYSIPHPIGILRYIRPVDGIWVYEADTKKNHSAGIFESPFYMIKIKYV